MSLSPNQYKIIGILMEGSLYTDELRKAINWKGSKSSFSCIMQRLVKHGYVNLTPPIAKGFSNVYSIADKGIKAYEETKSLYKV